MIGGKPNQAYFFYGYAGTNNKQETRNMKMNKEASSFFVCCKTRRKKFRIQTINCYVFCFVFVFFVDDDLLYMDPHECQPYVDNLLEDMNDSSYHINNIWKLKFSLLDPSVALVIKKI